MKQNKSTTNTIQQHNKKHGSSIMAAHSWQHIFSQQQSNTNNNSNKKQQRRNSPFIRTILNTTKILLIPAGIYQSALTIYTYESDKAYSFEDSDRRKFYNLNRHYSSL